MDDLLNRQLAEFRKLWALLSKEDKATLASAMKTMRTEERGAA